MNYDYTIIGAGAAGLNLALAMIQEPFFNKKQVLIIESSNKRLNDKTWCYWEKGKGQFDHLIYKHWEDGHFFSRSRTVQLNLGKYRYKMLRSADFYQHALHQIRMQDNFTFKAETVESVNEFEKSVQINTTENVYISGHIFDSRPPTMPVNHHPFLWQHFKGWMIKLPDRILDDERFTVMDFRNNIKNETCFHYVLKTERNEALVECTFFSEKLVDKKVYDNLLKAYIENQLGQKKYTIQYEESGAIPMTTYDFGQNNSKRTTFIGTAGGWVKPSTGYSFKFCQKYSKQLVSNIVCQKNNINISQPKRFKFYDRIFLSILQNEAGSGNDLFRNMYVKNKMFRILKFLDEDSNIFEEISILYSFVNFTFIRSLYKVVRKK